MTMAKITMATTTSTKVKPPLVFLSDRPKRVCIDVTRDDKNQSAADNEQQLKCRCTMVLSLVLSFSPRKTRSSPRDQINHPAAPVTAADFSGPTVSAKTFRIHSGGAGGEARLEHGGIE